LKIQTKATITYNPQNKLKINVAIYHKPK